MCGIRFRARTHTTRFCGSQTVRGTCSYKNHINQATIWMRNHPNVKKQFYLKHPFYARDMKRYYKSIKEKINKCKICQQNENNKNRK
jgi:hypothetical protein